MKIIVLDKTPEADLLKVNFLADEYEKAHEDYKNRKHEITGKLYTIWRNDEIPAIYRNWIRQAARFINEREI